MTGMRARLGALVGTAAAVTAIAGAASAGAATEFGSNCQASSGELGYTLVSIGHGAGSPLPVTAPVSGVITRWSANTTAPVKPELSGAYAQRLLLFRATAVPTSFTLVAESAPGPISGPISTFPTRIPVQAGDYLGSTGALITLICSTGDAADRIGAAETPAGIGIGSTTDFKTGGGFQAPVSALIEPDADGDAYGDETQDGCPQSAAYQTPCPVIVLDAYGQAGGKAVTVSVATSLSTSVGVSGTVTLGQGKTAKLSAKAKTVNPGRLGKFRLKFPQALVERLKELPPGEKLTLKVTTKATNLTGPVSTDKLKAKLKGQG